MGGNINFGSRSEFLPGERSEEMDIKYGRYGGCFVTYKRGVLYVVGFLLFTALVAYLVYHYSSSCRHEANSVDKKADNILSQLLQTAEENELQATKRVSKISSDIIPSYYNLKIQPYLDESGPKNFSFEGQVSIVFQINDSPTKTIKLNTKDLEIPQTDVSVTYTTSKPEPAALVAEAQVKEEESTSIANTDATSESSQSSTTEPATTVAKVTEEEVATTLLPNNETTSIAIDDSTNSSTASTISSESGSSTSSPPLSSDSADSPSINTAVTVKPEISSTSTTTATAEVITESKENIVQIQSQNYNDKDETYTIKLKFPLEKGINYTLNMKFSGKISDGYGGILRSSYKQANNTKWLAYTLLRPSFARTVFPCFDVPSYKTKFEIAVARRTSMSVVSNMFLKDTYAVKDSTGWVWDHFEMTPPMSTHSVAFAVFDFNSTNSEISVPYPVTKIWSRTETEGKGKYTLKVAPKLIENYNKFFGYNYSLNKVDLVTIPNLPVGSYGSWGILFFRENELLIEDDSSFEEKEHLLHTLSRELAQEWFGNLISVQSWSDSWLTETISNYAHYFGMNLAEPTWDIMDEAFISDMQDILDIDSMDLLPKITSMSANFERDFDQQLLIAKKGSLMMRMLNISLTEVLFTTGIKTFVNKWKYKNFIQDNFWDELNSTDKLPTGIYPKDIANLWITQKGYPLITVTRTEHNSLSVQQAKYSEAQLPSIDLWILPVYYNSDSSSNNIVWLSEKSPKVIENQNSSWVFFNSPAPCRINYDLDNWQTLISLLKSSPETLSPANRAQLLDDAFHLARTGLLNYSVVLNMTLYLREKEQHVIPWTTALRNFQYLDLIISKTPNYGYFEDFIMQLLKPMYDKLIQNNNNDYGVEKLKKIIVDWSCKLRYKSCRDWAIAQYDPWSKSANPDTENTIPKDLRSTVYCVGVQNYGRSAWEFLWRRYENAKYIPDESRALINGMSCATESWLLMKYLLRTLDEDHLQNSVLMWTTMSSELAVNSAFEFMRENWSKVYNKYKHSELAHKQILNGVLSKLTSENDLEKVLELFSNEPSNFNGFAQDMIVIIEKLKQKITWKKTYMTTLNSWIQNNT